VERVNHDPLYELGKTLEAVGSRNGDVLTRDVFLPVYNALIAMNNLMNNLLSGTPFPLGVCRTAAIEFRNALQEIWNQFLPKSMRMAMRLLNFQMIRRKYSAGRGAELLLR
jgi:hypothetical protein